MIDPKKEKKAIAGIKKVIALYNEMAKDESCYLQNIIGALWQIKGDMFFKTGNEKEGVKCYEKIGEWDSLFSYCIDKEQYDEAFKYCKRLHSYYYYTSEHDYNHYYETFIDDLLNIKKYETALDFLESLQSELDYNFYIVRKGDCLEQLGKFEEAITCYDYALQNTSKSMEYDKLNRCRRHKGLCLLYLGKIDEGITCINELTDKI
jgi:tetratricopeptide (TPR) repeat protein